MTIALLGALLGAVAYRVRGTAWGKWYGRVACALLVSLPVLFHGLNAVVELGPYSLPLGVALAVVAYLLAACVSFTTVGLPHDPSGANWLQQAATGAAFTLPCAVVLLLLGAPDWWLVAAAGLLKAACYRLPEGREGHRFLWRESAFGAVWGAAVGVNL